MKVPGSTTAATLATACFFFLSTTAGSVEEARRAAADAKTVTDYLDALAADGRLDDVFSRKVLMDYDQVSLNDRLGTRDPKKSTGSWRVNGHNVYAVSHLLNAVVSCELGDVAYRVATLIDRRSDACRSDETAAAAGQTEKEQASALIDRMTAARKCYRKLQQTLEKPAAKALSDMVMTLAALMKLTKNPSSKKHEMLRILASWQVFLVGDEQHRVVDYNPTERLDDVRLTCRQVLLYLERFSMVNCRRAWDGSAQRFRARAIEFVDGLLQTSSGGGGGDETADPAYERIMAEHPLIKHRLDGLRSVGDDDEFALSADDKRFDALWRTVLEGEVKESVRVVWESRFSSLRDAFNVYVVHTPHVRTVIKFERIVLKMITNVAGKYVASVLDAVLAENDGDGSAAKSRRCREAVMERLDACAARLRADDQPSYLVNSLTMLSRHAWAACNAMRQPGSAAKAEATAHVNKVGNALQSANFPRSTEAEFAAFLERLHKVNVCTRLHPAVSNAYWDSMHVQSTGVYEYAVDFKVLHTGRHWGHHPADDPLVCKAATRAADELSALAKEMAANVNRQADEDGGECYVRFFESTDAVRLSVQQLVQNRLCHGSECIEWKRLLLMLVHNADRVSLFHGVHDPYWMADRRLLFAEYPNLLLNLVDFRRAVGGCLWGQVMPADGADEPPQEAGSCTGSTRVWEKLRNTQTRMTRAIRSAWRSETTERTRDAIEFVDFFGVYDALAAGVGAVRGYDATTGGRRELRLRWDGVERTMEEVNDHYDRVPFDPQQDAVDGQNFVVRWIAGLTYAALADIVDDIVAFGRRPPDQDVWDLRSAIRSLHEVPLLGSRSLHINHDMFFDALEWFPDNGVAAASADAKATMKYYRAVLRDELELVGADRRSVPNLKDSVPVRLRALAEVVRKIVKVLEDTNFSSNKNVRKTNRDELLATVPMKATK